MNSEVSVAFDSLKTYDRGSGRAALLLLDRAVAASSKDAEARKQLEQRLAALLRAGISTVAAEYVCSKLALIGTEFSVPALAARLADPQLAHAARTALETMPCREAAKALRDNLRTAKGRTKLGVISSLGAGRDADSVGALAALLKDGDPEMAAAAAAALGEIGSTKAARALRAYEPKAPEALRAKLSDALLTCAERLLAAKRAAEARTLYELLAARAQIPHVREAARLGLKRTASKARPAG